MALFQAQQLDQDLALMARDGSVSGSADPRSAAGAAERGADGSAADAAAAEPAAGAECADGGPEAAAVEPAAANGAHRARPLPHHRARLAPDVTRAQVAPDPGAQAADEGRDRREPPGRRAHPEEGV